MISDSKYTTNKSGVLTATNGPSQPSSKMAGMTSIPTGPPSQGSNNSVQSNGGLGLGPKLIPNQYQPIKSIMNYANSNMNMSNNYANMHHHQLNHHNHHNHHHHHHPMMNGNGMGNQVVSNNMNNNNNHYSNNNNNNSSINNNNSKNDVILGKKYSSKTLACSSSSSTNSSTSSTGSVNVKFSGFFKDKIDEREKYLTAKYPNHQMALIKKRLKVEFWIDEQLKNLFNINV